MKNDITRDTFDPAKNFSRVLMQQGRVQLDADWNEQVSILLDYLRTLTVDLIGPEAGPADNCGFELVVDASRLPSEVQPQYSKVTLGQDQVLVSPGRYYVGGLLVENDDYVFLDSLRFGAVSDIKDKLTHDNNLGELMVYLNAWERQVTPIEDDYIREKALGGRDTATRAKVDWRIEWRQLTEPAETTIDKEEKASRTTLGSKDVFRSRFRDEFEKWSKSQEENRGLLLAQIKPAEECDDPCVCATESAYRGCENQLYRVEIHQGGFALNENGAPQSVATFKWARNNASFVVPWQDDDDGALKIGSMRDRACSISVGQWIELSDERHEHDGSPGILVQVQNAEAGSLTIDTATAEVPVARQNFGAHATVREWDQQETESLTLHDGAIAIEHGKWITLEDGVQVQFPARADDKAPPFRYRSGDYWLIPARVATKDIEWPREPDGRTARAVPPKGMSHHYALLGRFGLGDSNKISFTDLRGQFEHLPLKTQQ